MHSAENGFSWPWASLYSSSSSSPSKFTSGRRARYSAFSAFARGIGWVSAMFTTPGSETGSERFLACDDRRCYRVSGVTAVFAVLIHKLPRAIDAAQRFVLGKAVPRTPHQVL